MNLRYESIMEEYRVVRNIVVARIDHENSVDKRVQLNSHFGFKKNGNFMQYVLE